MNPVEVRMIGQEYHSYVFGKFVSKGKNLRKVMEKTTKFIKGME